MILFDTLREYAVTCGDMVILEDEIYGEYTYSYIEDASARIYAFLADRKIGTEDVVVIRMRRSARIFLVMLGVWKARAAFVVIGEHSPQNYAEHVLAEAAPCLVFDDETFEAAMKCAAREGYRRAALHDLACIVYSTGSSGVFKGAMHEYGAVQMAAEWYRDNFDYFGNNQNRSLFGSGFYTVTAMFIIGYIITQNYQYVVPYEKLLDDEEMAGLVMDKQCTKAGGSPKLVNRLLGLNGSALKMLFSSYDVMDDVSCGEIAVYNSYGLTESFGDLSAFRIDGAYDIVPIGRAYEGYLPLSIHDREEQDTDVREIGEICFVPGYFRGYRKRPDLTEKVLYNGWFHTGDMGFVDENGNYICLGRKIDMIETEEGYIVPAIIALETKKHFPGIDKCYVKLFGDADKYKICLYYCGGKDGEAYPISAFRSALSGSLPEYMLPTHCQRMEDFVYYPSGKVNRLSFQEIEACLGTGPF